MPVVDLDSFMGVFDVIVPSVVRCVSPVVCRKD